MRSFGVGSRIGHDSTGFYSRKIYDEVRSKVKKKGGLPTNKIPTADLDKIYAQSCESMSQLPDNSVHLMVTSPPYNVGKEYDNNLTAGEYRDMLCKAWSEVFRVLVDGGRACINVANLGRKPYLPLNTIITSDMLDIGFQMRGEIIWNKAASAGSSCAWGSWMSPSNPVLRDVHEYIMVFCKESFDMPPTNGNKATINKDQFLEYTKSIWTFHAESAKKVKHPAPYPLELPARFIQLYTYTDDIVLDPFMGSGTTALAAKQAGRHYIGYEISREYIQISHARLNGSK